jgi:hypothetical protein
MKATTQQDFKKVVFELLKETFEGPAAQGASAFLNKGTGLFQTLDEITADRASTQTRPGGSTIVAHTEHVRFYVVVHYKLVRGSTEAIDWEQSWRIKTVNSAEWNDLRQELRRDYSTVTDYLRALDSWGEDEISVAMAIITHTAYHLGAIRQLMRALELHS